MQEHICVIGLGHIGLPIACTLADIGYQVLGVDINPRVIEQIKSFKLNNPEPNLQKLLIKCIKNGRFKVSNKPKEAEVYIIAVPTPLTKLNKSDISYVIQAIKSISPLLKANDLILIESTCPIGTTNQIANKLKNIIQDIYIAYCPERILPGNALLELVNNTRIVGGIDKDSSSKAALFYQSFVKGIVLETNAKTAEAVKLAENTFRDINIAYANELSMIFDQLNLNTQEIIQLANYHPRVNILQPGPGVGGHCIAIDPVFLAQGAPKLANLIKQARKVNINKTTWIINKIKQAIIKNNAKKIACLGLTYKPNVSDTRESPALQIVQTLEKDHDVLRVDPYISDTVNLHDAINKADIVVGLVAHSVFRNIKLEELKEKIILDFAQIF